MLDCRFTQIELSADEIKKRLVDLGIDTSKNKRYTIADIASMMDLVFLRYDDLMRMKEV